MQEVVRDCDGDDGGDDYDVKTPIHSPGYI